MGTAIRELLAPARMSARPDFLCGEPALHPPGLLCVISGLPVRLLDLVSPEGELEGCSFVHTQLLHPSRFD